MALVGEKDSRLSKLIGVTVTALRCNERSMFANRDSLWKISCKYASFSVLRQAWLFLLVSLLFRISDPVALLSANCAIEISSLWLLRAPTAHNFLNDTSKYLLQIQAY